MISLLMKWYLIPLLLLSFPAFSQSNFQPFIASDYPDSLYQIKTQQAGFYDFKIELIHVHRLKEDGLFGCRAWLSITNGSQTVYHEYFEAIEALGGWAGLFLPEVQPLVNYFFISKYGDYAGRVIILDTDGNLSMIPGGDFSISDDSRYLFTSNFTDIGGITVYDLVKNEVLFTVEGGYVLSWYYQDGKYYALFNDMNYLPGIEAEVNIAVFNLTTRKFENAEIEKSQLKQDNALSLFGPDNECKCNCGFNK